MTTRREFLAGGARRQEERPAGSPKEPATPGALLPGGTLRLGTVAMRADFEVILPPGPAARIELASQALERLEALEDQLSVYRPQSELSLLNARAAHQPVRAEPELYALLKRAVGFAAQTAGAYDPTAGRLVALWRSCRAEHRLPRPQELEAALRCQGFNAVRFHDDSREIEFSRPGIALNLNAIGKGYALDRLAAFLDAGRGTAGGAGQLALHDYLLHGGSSSMVARGALPGSGGWPVGLADPRFPARALATIVLQNQALSTSGSAVQYFRYRGKRYGHIVDPRTGMPAEEVLSVTVVAPDAAQAEALSTAFFVLGVEKSLEYCHNHEGVAMFLVPAARGRAARPVAAGFAEGTLHVDSAAMARPKGMTL